MLKGDGCKIINVADWSGLRPYASYIPYCVSKGGLITLTKALAKELAPKIQVNAVLPGPILLPPEITEEERKKILKNTPLNRFGTPDDVAKSIRFLLEEGDFMTGSLLVVDGGRLIA
jgi:NAD(P)-dependent dehydrogenase (short-subunit alcohol dehydrogenase family)